MSHLMAVNSQDSTNAEYQCQDINARCSCNIVSNFQHCCNKIFVFILRPDSSFVLYGIGC